MLRRVVGGQTNREIALACGITVQSVKNVLSSVYAKWHVRNRVELAVRAVRDGVVSDAEIARPAPE